MMPICCALSMSLPRRSSDTAAAARAPLGAAQLEKKLDDALDAVLSARRTAQPLALNLAPLERELQDFTLHWVAVIARTNGELAYQFASLAPTVLHKIDLSSAEAWIIHAMDTFDREGLYRGSAELKNVDAFIRAAHEHSQAATFEDANNVLGLFICGLAGRRLKLEAGSEAYTDTDAIHLPARIASEASRQQNFLMYKAMATHLWAQARYGTFNVDLLGKLGAYADAERALALYHYFETVRIDAIISRELPGLARELNVLRAGVDPPAGCSRLEKPEATAADSLALVTELYATFTPPRLSYMGKMRPDIAQAVRSARVAREKKELRAELADILEKKAPDQSSQQGAARYSIANVSNNDVSGGIELSLNGEPVAASEHVDQLLQSIAQDLGKIPDDYLLPAGKSANRKAHASDENADDAGAHADQDRDAVLYNEWDYKRRHYRKNWCVLRETDVQAGDAAFVENTVVKYALQVSQLRRTFEMLRGEDRWMKQQQGGDEIDLDAVISAYADMHTGVELTERLFIERHKAERDIAVMFMVDMSGSTKGWINEAEREALAILCEALEVLGDRYAIYGFSGITRKRCEIYRIKRFSEKYDDTVRRRIAGIQPHDYTRMGVAIRHLTALLNAVDARTKLLITLSDGKPDDYSDNYRGEYGVEDTRQALIEAHRGGVHPFCITIDREAREYLPRMYGAVNYTLIDDVGRLPLKVADVYRRLTS
jgi:nitric oxide reductase NorD protein